MMRVSVFPALFILTFIACPVSPSLAEETIAIQSDTLEYEAGTNIYTASGHVKIQKGMATMEAARAVYDEKTSDLSAEGNVTYDDPDVSIKAERAELNLESKTGKLYRAEISSKKDNYHITGLEIEKRGEKEYAVNRASFTTCDAPVPAWCFKGRDVEVVVGDRLRARGVTFHIKDLPVLYTPYLSAPIERERKTGLLFPAIGYVKSKGLHYEQPFFWAISENRDATFLMDVYSKRGIGEGLEYRYIERDGSRANLWSYHLRDKDLGRDFWDLRWVYENRDRAEAITGYLNLNYINSRDYYKNYNPYIINKTVRFLDPASYLSKTTERFIESTAEVSVGSGDSRLFLTSRYLIDLKDGTDASTIPQRLPEAGYFLGPRKVGPFVFSLSSALSNFWREASASGQRLDIYPRFAYSTGSDVVVTQVLGLRETAYSLHNADDYGRRPHREGLDYSITATTRLVKDYSTFIHILEPSLGYTFIPSSNSDLPLFDSAELYTKTSTIGLSLNNRFMDSNGEFMNIRVTQAYDSFKGDRAFLPLRLDVAIHRPLGLRGEASYDPNTGRIETINSDAGISISKASFTIGERYNRSEDILFYSFGVNYSHSKAVSVEGNFWYDAKRGELKDIIAKLKYQKQCWGATLVFTKREKDYSVSVLFNLLGLGTIKI